MATKGKKTNDDVLDEVKETPVFDYRNLEGEEFDRYLAYINSLQWDELRDFGLYPAEGKFKKVLDPDTLLPVSKLYGIRLKDQQPKSHTRVPVKHVKDLNSQIEQNTPNNTGFYYLLKQKP